MENLFGENIIEKKLIEKDVLESVLKNNMKDITEQELVSMMYSRFNAIIDFAKLCAGEKAGEKISMLFNPHRYATPTLKSKSIVDGFKTDSFLSGLARATLFKEGKVNELLYQVLQLGINGIQYVNEFPPFTAREFILKFNAKTVLDPCAGWGGRMIGVASIGGKYHGFEPATKTHKGLLELGGFLKTFNNGFEFNVECLPFEDARLSLNYDLAITSPPYYDTEIYSEETTNSCNRYSTFEKWCEGFYLPMVRKTMEHTNRFILNVGLRQYDLKSILFNNFNVEEIKSGLSGKSGLGKQKEGAESFYLITN